MNDYFYQTDNMIIKHTKAFLCTHLVLEVEWWVMFSNYSIFAAVNYIVLLSSSETSCGQLSIIKQLAVRNSLKT